MGKRWITSLFRLGIREKIILILLTVLLVALTVSGWKALEQEKSNTLKEIDQRGSDISRFVAKSLAFSVVGYDYHTIQLLLNEITSSDDIGYAKVSNKDGKIMVESGSLNDGDDSLVVFHQAIKLDTEVVGELMLGLSTSGTIERLESQKYSLLKREAIIILLIALGEFLALSFIIIRPLRKMSDSLTESVDERGMVVAKIPITTQDEFGRLAAQFNNLGEQLNEANRRLQNKIEMADQKLIETNKRLLKQSEELQHISEEFRKMSITDALTGLYNRRHFEELMNAENRISQQHGTVNSLLVIDIDHFKRINDKYGHLFGDNVLKQVAEKLKSKVRRTDILCRVGGEEFVALCRMATKEQAMEIAEKLRKELSREVIMVGDEQIMITISIGVATSNIDEHERDTDNLYRKADAAVYYSKENGRNCITHHDYMLLSENSGSSLIN